MTINKYNSVLNNMERLLVMRDLAMLDGSEEPFFNKLTGLASEIMNTPVSLVSLVAANYQFFKSAHGLPPDMARKTPVSHSFCKHVVGTGEPLIVNDATQHPLVQDNPAVEEMGVLGYLGIPLKTREGKRFGSFCVVDMEPHDWTEDEIRLMEAFANLVNAEIDARAQARQDGRLQAHIDEAQQWVEWLRLEINPQDSTDKIIRRLDRLAKNIETA